MPSDWKRGAALHIADEGGSQPIRVPADAAEAAAPLRVGILCADDGRFENWELQLFEMLLAERRFTLAAFLLDSRPFAGGRSGLPLDLVSRVDASLFARQPPFRAPRFAAARPGVTRFALDGAETAETAEAFRALALDVVLRHASAPLPAGLLSGVPLGEWRFSFIDSRSATADWTGIREVVARAGHNAVHIVVRDAEGCRRTASASFNRKFSAARGAAFMKEKAVLLMVHELTQLARTRRLPADMPPAGDPPPPPDAPTIARYAAGLGLAATRRAFATLRKRLHMETATWTLYCGHGSVEDFDPRRAVAIPPSATSIKADPFLFAHGGAHYVFYENYGMRDNRAHIAVGRLAGDRIEPIGIALGGQDHLSFPYVFRDGSDIFMIPETHRRNRIEIWRSTGFPLHWKLHATAFEGRSAADSVLFRHEDRWWLLTNLSEHHAFEDHCSALYAFAVDGPALSDIRPHKYNPVVIGSATARNAGRVFASGGRLFRPSQNNAHGIYGYGLNIMEIDTLSLDAYREHRVRAIAPDFKPGLIGCHHFDADGGRYILDARLSG